MFTKYIFIVLTVLCVFELNLCQGLATSTPEQSNKICDTCICADSIVDCTNKNILQPFEEIDWIGLTAFNPTEVNLSYNTLTEVQLIPELPIKVLNFSHCSIRTIQMSSFKNLELLEVIDLSNNDIDTTAMNRGVFMNKAESPPPNIKQFTNMRHISLAYNEIHSLPQFAFASMTSISILDLSGNPLAYIDQVTLGALSDLVNLKELYLSSCELESLPEGMFRRQRQLRVLDLSNNRFTTVPTVLKEASNIRRLNFDRNSIETLDENNAIKSLTKLEELSICRNSKLKTIAAYSLGGLDNLARLYMTNNIRLTSIDPDFLVNKDGLGLETWPLIKELYLNNNNLSVINSHFIHRWDLLTAGDFSNNPYCCDCNSQWMVDVLVDLLQAFGDKSSNMICLSPPELRGASFFNLRNSTRVLTCPQSENLTENVVSNTAIMLGIMIGIFVTFPIVLIIVLLWRRGHFAKCRKIKEDTDQDEMEHF